MNGQFSHDYFSFQLKNEGYRPYRRRTAFIFILNAISFGFLSFRGVSSFQRILLITMACMLIIYAAYCLFSQSSKKYEYIVIYLFPAFLWITELHFWPVGMIMIMLLVLNVLVETDTRVSVSGKGIGIKNYRHKFLNWSELENMILKDGLLSLDFRNNKIFQAEPDLTKPVTVHSTNSGSLNNIEWQVGEDYADLERSFNNFAKQKLDENK